MVDPAFQVAQRTDDHPVGDIRAGQRWLRAVFQAFAQSPQWERGVFVAGLRRVGRLLRPRDAADRCRDDRASKLDAEDFGAGWVPGPDDRGVAVRAAGLRRPHRLRPHVDPAVPRVALPRRRPRRAPRPASGRRWWLTERDRHAANLGATLTTAPQVDLGFDVTMDLPAPADPCTFGAKGGASPGDPFFGSQAMEDLQDSRFKSASEAPWSHAS